MFDEKMLLDFTEKYRVEITSMHNLGAQTAPAIGYLERMVANGTPLENIAKMFGYAKSFGRSVRDLVNTHVYGEELYGWLVVLKYEVQDGSIQATVGLIEDLDDLMEWAYETLHEQKAWMPEPEEEEVVCNICGNIQTNTIPSNCSCGNYCWSQFPTSTE